MVVPNNVQDGTPDHRARSLRMTWGTDCPLPTAYCPLPTALLATYLSKPELFSFMGHSRR